MKHQVIKCTEIIPEKPMYLALNFLSEKKKYFQPIT